MAMRYGKSLFQDNSIYTVHAYKSRDEWVNGRQDLHGIGGSDASAALGMSPWKTNLELWQEKTGRRKHPNISNNERVQYGTDAEEYIRRLFQLKHRDDYEIQYQKDTILQNRMHPEMLYSPDGLILDKNGRRGILEIKTSWLMKSWDKEKWYNRQTKQQVLPNNYYIQVLHGMNVTECEFMDLYAELVHPNGNSELVQYHAERDELTDELETVYEGIIEFWRDVIADTEPALILPEL